MSRAGTRSRRFRHHETHKAYEARLHGEGVGPLAAYWEARYATGGDSGSGSTGDAAQRKAGYINNLIRAEQVTSVVDWGCGDGQQLALLRPPAAYVGVDISPTAVARCLSRFPGRAFVAWAGEPPLQVRADLALSLDVIFHLVTDGDFADYWRRLFASARRLVLVHATDHDATGARHVRHRHHSHLAPAGWTLVDRASDPEVPGFYLWRRL